MSPPPAPEPDRRRAKYRQIEAEWQRRREGLLPKPPTVPTGPELRALLDGLAREPDLGRLRGALAGWRQRPGYFLNQGRTMYLGGVMGRVAPDPAAVEVFLDGLRVPAGEDQAAIRIRRLYDLIEGLRSGSNLAPGMMVLLQTDFWSCQEPDAWPVLWKDGEDFLRQFGWLAEGGDPAERYLAYRRLLASLDPRPSHAADCLSWYSGERAFCGLDPSLVARCQENADLMAEWNQATAYPTAEQAEQAERNVLTLRAELDLALRALQRPIEQALGMPLRPGSMALRTSNAPHRPFRAEGFAALYLRPFDEPGNISSVSFRLWVTRDGVAVGLKPSWVSNWTLDDYRRAGKVVEAVLPAGLTFMSVGPHMGDRIRPEGPEAIEGDMIFGRWFAGAQALDRADFADEIVATAAALRPAAEAMLAAARPAPVVEPSPEPEGPPSDIDPIATLAEELLLDPSFLEDVVGLLREKRQVIFYGPPGTGKTYVAKKLAEALAPEVERRMVVQFHPSTGYEDFFEGFRPEMDAGGGLRYALVPGPLALLAERARHAPASEHLMVIDEINRGNLPRILGELLFLLEYRDETVHTLYRPDQPFSLPKNLLFIGTMNTADRSIALVDAALRRRFRFVPFFPHEGPLAELLRRWLASRGEPAWVAELLDMVNGELRDHLGGPHLQIGPSHFMVPGLDEARLRRIWDFSVFPFIEEQLYGDWEAIPRYRFEAVLRRFRRDVEDAFDAGTGFAHSPDPLPDA